MQSGIPLLNLQVAAPAKDLAVLGDQGSTDGNATLGGTLFCLFDGGDKAWMLIHCSDGLVVGLVARFPACRMSGTKEGRDQGIWADGKPVAGLMYLLGAEKCRPPPIRSYR